MAMVLTKSCNIIWVGVLKKKLVTHDEGQRLMSIGLLSDSGDLIYAYSYMTIDSPSLKAKAQQKHNKCSTKVSGNLQI